MENAMLAFDGLGNGMEIRQITKMGFYPHPVQDGMFLPGEIFNLMAPFDEHFAKMAAKKSASSGH
jgi:hypothetical protein